MTARVARGLAALAAAAALWTVAPARAQDAAPEPSAPAPDAAAPEAAPAEPQAPQAEAPPADAPRPQAPAPLQGPELREPPSAPGLGAGARAQRRAPPPSPPATAPLLGGRTETAQALRVLIGLTVLAILPALLVSVTSFLRIIIVLSMLRHAIGMSGTPPNMVLTGLALFLTLFTMSPVLQKVDAEAFRPFMRNEVTLEEGYAKGVAPLREFMLRQTREADVAFVVELSKIEAPRTPQDVPTAQLVTAFMLSELRAAFQIGFVIFLPFLLIDLVVSSILMSLGMMMMPPTTVSLPLKVLMFVLVDGWSLLLKALVGSFH